MSESEFIAPGTIGLTTWGTHVEVLNPDIEGVLLNPMHAYGAGEGRLYLQYDHGSRGWQSSDSIDFTVDQSYKVVPMTDMYEFDEWNRKYHSRDLTRYPWTVLGDG
jgi:hypothetical protein